MHIYFFVKYPNTTIERLNQNVGIQPEPRLDPLDPEAELGYAWEKWLCGRATILPIAWPRRFHGMYWSPLVRGSDYLFHGLSDDCMAAFFNMNHWTTFQNWLMPHQPYQQSGGRFNNTNGLYLELTAMRFLRPLLVEGTAEYEEEFMAEQLWRMGW